MDKQNNRLKKKGMVAYKQKSGASADGLGGLTFLLVPVVRGLPEVVHFDLALVNPTEVV